MLLNAVQSKYFFSAVYALIMRGPPETIEEIGAIEGQEIISTSNRRHLVDVDYSEYEWMGEEGVEEFDRRVCNM